MTRRLPAVVRDVIGDPRVLHEILASDPGRWLPDPARRSGLDGWTVMLWAGPLTRLVMCRIGPVWRIGHVLWRGMDWQPRPERDDVVPLERWLPSLRGEVGLQMRGEVPQLVVEGRYEPPAGAVGHAADAAVLHRVATATAGRFLDDVAERLTGPAATTPATSDVRRRLHATACVGSPALVETRQTNQAKDAPRSGDGE